MEITFLGEKHDKIAVCRHCRTMVDLPDTRGVTREKITERPGHRVVERVTTWESDLQPDLRKLLAGLLPRRGREMDDEELRRQIGTTLPPDVAERLLAALGEDETVTGPHGFEVRELIGEEDYEALILVGGPEPDMTVGEAAELLPRFEVMVTAPGSRGCRLLRVRLEDQDFTSLDELRAHISGKHGGRVADAVLRQVRAAVTMAEGGPRPRQSSARREPGRKGLLAKLRRLLGD